MRPDNSPMADARVPYFVLPEWVRDPVTQEPGPPAITSVELRQGRYVVDGVLHFTNAGGIYLATDTRTGRRVVVKEGRPHVSVGPRAEDAVALLAREHALLERIVDLRVAPEPIELFDEWDEALAFAIQIGHGLDRAHSAGSVHRDLKPAT